MIVVAFIAANPHVGWPVRIAYGLVTLLIFGAITRRYRRHYGALRFKSPCTICTGCLRKMSYWTRIVRADGYCSMTCMRADMNRINALAVGRLHEEHLRLQGGEK